MSKIFFYNENCFDTMKKMEGKGYKVDVVLTSPPYATSRSKVQTEKALETYNRRYDICLDSMTEEEYADWTVKLFNGFDKVLSENGVVLYNVSYGNENPDAMWLALLSVIKETPFRIADTIIWKKKSALPNNVGNKLTRITEFVFIFCRKSEYKTFFINKKVKTIREDTGQKYYESIYNFIEAPNNDGACKLNKATYSSDLCLKLLELYARPTCVVYDPFMGTGTTGVACMRIGGEYKITCIGSELSEAQVEYSCERCHKYKEENNIEAVIKCSYGKS